MPDKDSVVTFLQDVCSRFEKFCLLFNFPEVLEKKMFDSKLGPLEVHTSKGNVFEKASLIYCDLKIETPPVLAGATRTEGQHCRSISG